MNKFDYKILYFNLGRECLRHIVKTFGIKEIKIPYYLCDAIRHTLFEEGCKPVFYHIDDDFLPSEEFSKEDFILYPNYFGICTKNIKDLVNIYPKLIVDNAHAYYDNPLGFACFNAGHKFGRENSTLWIKGPTFDIQEQEEIPQIYKERFLEFHKKYCSENLLNIDIQSITAPFVYPFLANSVEMADEIAKTLKEQGKTVYRYWNPLPKTFNEYKFYSRLVPIPLV